MGEDGAVSRPGRPGGCDAPAVAETPEPDGMQSLLARAVEDQANEQRLVSTTLVQIQDQLDALDEGVRATGPSLIRLDVAVSTVVEDLRATTDTLSAHLASTTASVDALAGGLTGDQTARRVGELTISLVGQLENLEESLDGLTTQLTDRADSASVAALAARLDALHPLVADLGTQLKALTTGLSGFRGDVEDGQVRTVAALAALPAPPTLEQIAALLGAERERSDALTRALVHESEQRVLGHVDDAVYALAKALLPPRKPVEAELAPGPPAPPAEPSPSTPQAEPSPPAPPAEPRRSKAWRRTAPVE
jgi:hypothetical protein